jgi:antitoxin CcdA
MIRPIRRPDMDKVRLEIAIDRDLADHAEQHGLDVSAEAERGLRRRLGSTGLDTDEAARRWREENAEAIRISNEELERDGLWSDGHRLF